MGRALTQKANLFGGLAATSLAGDARERAAQRIAEGQIAAGQGQAAAGIIESIFKFGSERLGGGDGQDPTPTSDRGGGRQSGDNEFQEFEQDILDDFNTVSSDSGAPDTIFNEETGEAEPQERSIRRSASRPKKSAAFPGRRRAVA